nr:NS1 [Parvovirinae sp.]
MDYTYISGCTSVFSHSASGFRRVNISGRDLRSVSTMAGLLRSFMSPAFTYTVRFPLDGKISDHEETVCELLAPGTFAMLKRLETCLPQEEGTDEVRDALLAQLRGSNYVAIFCKAVYMAMSTVMGHKQHTLFPTHSIVTQAEIGEENLHCHILVAGPNLSKRNAKIIKKDILSEVCTELLVRFRDRRELKPFTEEEARIYALVHRTQKEAWSGHVGNLCQILQYRNRNGEHYAQQIDPLRFFTNYFLPKNLQLGVKVPTSVTTPESSWFLLTDKTYGHTIINGLPLTWGDRKIYRATMDNEILGGPQTMAFGGAGPWEPLPEVGNQELDVSGSDRSKHRATKKDKLVLDLLARCRENNLITYEELVQACPELLVMIETQPGGSRLIESALEVNRVQVVGNYSALTYIFKQYGHPDLCADNKALKLLLTQGYNPWQVGHLLCCVLNKTFGKQNTVCLFGPASTGKTVFAKAIAEAVKLYGCVNHLNRSFIFNDCRQRLLVWWEEAVMHSEYVEAAKCILGGTDFRIDVKHRDSCLMRKTPVIISTNHDIYTVTGGNAASKVHELPLKERIVQLNFMKQLPQTFGEIAPGEIVQLLAYCFNRFDCTLQGFKSQWGIDKVPHSFPLSKLCPGHTQDYLLHANGNCTDCGGYLPHSADDYVYTDNASETSNSGGNSGECGS